MSSRVAALLHVRPCPSTLAESRAIYQHLASRVQGNVIAFKLLTRDTSSPQKNANSALFYTLLSATPVEHTFTVQPTFPDPRQDDPFNIRGLQNRKPYPPSRVFDCTIEYNNNIDAADKRQTLPNLGGLFSSTAPAITTASPATTILSSFYSHAHHTKRRDWLQHTLTELNTPPILRPGLGTLVTDNGLTATLPSNTHAKRAIPIPEHKLININGLMALYNAAITHAPRPKYVPFKAAVRAAPVHNTNPQEPEDIDIDSATFFNVARKLNLVIPDIPHESSQTDPHLGSIFTPMSSATPSSSSTSAPPPDRVEIGNHDDLPAEYVADDDSWIIDPLSPERGRKKVKVNRERRAAMKSVK